MGGRRQSDHDIAPIVRGAVKRAVKILEDKARNPNGKGKSLSELIAIGLEQDTPKMLSALARFMPREVNVAGTVEHYHTHVHVAVPDLIQWVDDILEVEQPGRAQQSLPSDKVSRPN